MYAYKIDEIYLGEVVSLPRVLTMRIDSLFIDSGGSGEDSSDDGTRDRNRPLKA